MSFNVINEGFICKNCGEKNPPQKRSCRNHCRKCLFSLHVDKKDPGDRLGTCKGLMEPILSYQMGKKGWLIVHKCIKCHKKIPNKIANDDNFDIVIKLSQPRTEK